MNAYLIALSYIVGFVIVVFCLARFGGYLFMYFIATLAEEMHYPNAKIVKYTVWNAIRFAFISLCFYGFIGLCFVPLINVLLYFLLRTEIEKLMRQIELEQKRDIFYQYWRRTKRKKN